MRDAVLHTNCQLLSVNCGLWCLKCSDVDECLQASAFHSGSSATLHSLITGGVSEQGRPCFNHRESKSLTAFPSAEPVCLGGNVLILSVLYTPRSQCNQKKKKKKFIQMRFVSTADTARDGWYIDSLKEFIINAYKSCHYPSATILPCLLMCALDHLDSDDFIPLSFKIE